MSLGFAKSPNGSTTPATVKAIPVPKPPPVIPPYDESRTVHIENLTFTYSNSNNSHQVLPPILENLNLTLPTGSRCLLIGANGSGKSTLLRIIAGRHLVSSNNGSKCEVLGLSSFHDTRLNFYRAYLDCDWGMRNVSFVGGAVPLMADIPVYKMMEQLQLQYKERRDELCELLNIDLYHWNMHQLSDGQRRRVQIMLGLLRPFNILLLDEVTTSLDVCVRQDLLQWLHKESVERNATIIYATHIFDGLDDWSSHLYYLTNKGKCGWQGTMDQLEIYHTLKEQNHPCKMLAIAEHWLRKELNEARALKIYEKAANKQDDPNGELYDPRSQGGYRSGRLQTDEERAAKSSRAGRISDIRGNAGGIHKVHRVADTTSASTTAAPAVVTDMAIN